MKILAHGFSVKLTARINMDPDCLGVVEYGNGRILIRTGMAKMQERATLLHEILHAIDSCIGLGLPEKDEDRILTGLATGILDVLRNNDWLVKYLVE